MTQTTQAAVREELAASLADRKLDNAERDGLRALAQTLSPDLRRFARNTAFDMSRDVISADAQDTFRVLGWLEQVCKALDVSPTAAPQQAAWFSPGDDCRRALLGLLNRAQQRLDICVFTISDNQLADAILAAHQRGVAVRIVTDNDKAHDRGSDVFRLQEAGVPVCMDQSDAHMHHKYALADGKALVTGSFNWTRSATTRNQENVLITSDARLVQDYQRDFDSHWEAWS